MKEAACQYVPYPRSLAMPGVDCFNIVAKNRFNVFYSEPKNRSKQRFYSQRYSQHDRTYNVQARTSITAAIKS